MSRDYIKVRFGVGETGWAEEREGGIRLNNLPLEPDLVIDDLVELGPPDGCTCCSTIQKVIERKWPLKSAIHYSPETRKSWVAVCDAVRESGFGWTEGWVAGIGGVAHTADLTGAKLKALLADTGVEVELVNTTEPERRGA